MTKNLQFEAKGPTFDSGRVHLGGFDVRDDHYRSKMNFEYSTKIGRWLILARADHTKDVNF